MVRSRQIATSSAQVESGPLPEKMWCIEAVATWLDVSKPTVRRLMRESGLPYFQDGDVLRFDPRAVERWFHEKSNKSA